MNDSEKTQPLLGQEASEQTVQETPPMLQKGLSMLGEKQLEEVVGAGWPLGLSGVKNALRSLVRSNSAPGRLERAPFHNPPPESSTSSSLSGDEIVHAGWSPQMVLDRAKGHL
jgi:hypothetical protein